MSGADGGATADGFRVHNRVLLTLFLAGAVGGGSLAFVAHAPNRLLSGIPVMLGALPGDELLVMSLLMVPLLAGALLPQRRGVHWVQGAAAAAFVLALCTLAGAEAARFAGGAPPAARTSLGAGFWIMALCGCLAMMDAMHRLALAAAGRALGALMLAGGIAVLGGLGALDDLSIAKEYANRREVLGDALAQHVGIVLAALLPTVLIGLPLGLVAARRGGFAAGLFPALNLIQTIPSIALFAMLMAPLAGLAERFPLLKSAGIGGIGATPAIIALVLYSLLPIARNVAEGIAGVPAGARHAAIGMGMTPRQVFARVELPLALPVVLSGLRIVIVQAIGLAAVAALIGAGGLGAIMFQGLFANALDTVVLGTVPIILLALAADAFLRLLTGHAERVRR